MSSHRRIVRWGTVDPVRWQPEGPVCTECGFEWTCEKSAAIAVVAALPRDAAEALPDLDTVFARSGRRWSAAMYLWHLVDVLRIGSERLLTLQLDPDQGVPCWDENGLAAARRYNRLSPIVGLSVLETVTAEWTRLALTLPEGEVEHPLLGSLSTVDIIRRAAHEAHHHLQDIRHSP